MRAHVDHVNVVTGGEAPSAALWGVATTTAAGRAPGGFGRGAARAASRRLGSSIVERRPGTAALRRCDGRRPAHVRGRDRAGARAARGRPGRRARRVRRADGAVGLRQVDPAAHRRRAGPARTRARCSWPAGRSPTLSESRLSKVRRRDVGMVFQFFHLLEGMSVAENIVLAAPGRRRLRGGTPTPARRSCSTCSACWTRRRSAPVGAVRRAAAAARDRPRAGQLPDPAARRRADRRPGQRRRRGGARAVPPAARRRPEHPDGHPQPRRRRRRAAHGAPARRRGRRVSGAASGYARQRLQLVAAGALVARRRRRHDLGLCAAVGRAAVAAWDWPPSRGARCSRPAPWPAQLARRPPGGRPGAGGAPPVALRWRAPLLLVPGRPRAGARPAAECATSRPVLPGALAGAAVAALAFGPLRRRGSRAATRRTGDRRPALRRSRCSRRSATGPPATCRSRSCCGSWPSRCATAYGLAPRGGVDPRRRRPGPAALAAAPGRRR